MNNYFLSKLSNINYRMAIHEGDANRRLAGQAANILFQLHLPNVPIQYKKRFGTLISHIDKTLSSTGGRIPIRIEGIRNVTAARYIKLLIDMQADLEDRK